MKRNSKYQEDLDFVQEMDRFDDEDIQNNEEKSEEENALTYMLNQIMEDAEEKLYNNEGDGARTVSKEHKANQLKVAELAASDNPDDVTAAMELAIMETEPFIRSTVYSALYGANNAQSLIEDCIHDVYSYICESIKSYNPQYSLTTFVKPKIIRAVQDMRSSIQNISTYFQAHAKKIQNAIEAFREKGIYNPSEKDIHILTGISMKTIKRTLEQRHAAKEVRIDQVEYDFLDSELGNPVDYSNSPDNNIIIQEKYEAVHRAMATLSEVERQIFVAKHVNNKSWLAIAEETGLTMEEVKRIEKDTTLLLRTSEHLASYNPRHRDAQARLDKHEIPTIPLDEAANLLDDLDLMDEQSEILYPEENANPISRHVEDLEDNVESAGDTDIAEEIVTEETSVEEIADVQEEEAKTTAEKKTAKKQPAKEKSVKVKEKKKKTEEKPDMAEEKSPVKEKKTVAKKEKPEKTAKSTKKKEPADKQVKDTSKKKLPAKEKKTSSPKKES